MDGEPRAALRAHLARGVLRRGDLHILTLVPPLLLVLDAYVGELHVSILDGELVRGGPCGDLFRRSIRPPRGVPVPPIVGLEEALVLPLQLVVEHDTLDARATALQPRRRGLIRTIDGRVVRHFTGLDEPRIVILSSFPAAS